MGNACSDANSCALAAVVVAGVFGCLAAGVGAAAAFIARGQLRLARELAAVTKEQLQQAKKMNELTEAMVPFIALMVFLESRQLGGAFEIELRNCGLRAARIVQLRILVDDDDVGVDVTNCGWSESYYKYCERHGLNEVTVAPPTGATKDADTQARELAEFRRDVLGGTTAMYMLGAGERVPLVSVSYDSMQNGLITREYLEKFAAASVLQVDVNEGSALLRRVVRYWLPCDGTTPTREPTPVS